jgi:hypothetical protein
MHLTDADLGAALDPAFDGGMGIRALTHAATCANCRGAIRLAQAADRDVADLLHLLDHAAATRDLASVRRRASEADNARIPVMEDEPWADAPAASHTAPRRAASRRPALEGRPRASAAKVTAAIRWGAIVLSLSAAAAAALPSVRQAIARMVGLSHAKASAPAPFVAVLPPPRPTTPVAPRGVAIVADGHAELVFRSAQPGGVLHIRPAAGTRVAVTASQDGSTYTVGRWTIVVDGGAPGTAYDIELPSPARLPEVSIRIGDRVVFARHGAMVSTRGDVQADGSYTISLSADSLPSR